MKHKTADLEGALLDQAVAKALGYVFDAQIHEDFIVVAIDRALPRPPDRNVRRSVCRIAVDFDGQPVSRGDERIKAASPDARCLARSFCPSTEWAHGGQIIERERIGVHPSHDGSWRALNDAWMDQGSELHADPEDARGAGSTPLIAAMRAFVASKLGEEVELP